MNSIFIALGANLSNPAQTFIRALDAMVANDIQVKAVSGLWKSPSWPPGKGHPDYLNAAAKVMFDGSAGDLLSRLNKIEDTYGRIREERNAPRILDLDILDFNNEIVTTEALTLPHPRMLGRGFVLFPLQQIAPNWIDPIDGISVQNHIARLKLSDVAAMSYAGKFYHPTGL